jgi:hypothetical protein
MNVLGIVNHRPSEVNRPSVIAIASIEFELNIVVALYDRYMNGNAAAEISNQPKQILMNVVRGNVIADIAPNRL